MHAIRSLISSSKICLPESVTQRVHHSMTVFSISPHCVWVVVFGGVKKWISDKSYRKQSSIGDTAVVELGNDHNIIMNVYSNTLLADYEYNYVCVHVCVHACACAGMYIYA